MRTKWTSTIYRHKLGSQPGSNHSSVSLLRLRIFDSVHAEFMKCAISTLVSTATSLIRLWGVCCDPVGCRPVVALNFEAAAAQIWREKRKKIDRIESNTRFDSVIGSPTGFMCLVIKTLSISPSPPLMKLATCVKSWKIKILVLQLNCSYNFFDSKGLTVKNKRRR